MGHHGSGRLPARTRRCRKTTNQPTVLKAGTKLVARYKGNDYGAEVVKGADGLLYRLGNGREFKSPSVAGSAVMGAKACNGWKFWSIAEAAPQQRAKKPVKKNKLEPASEHSAEQQFTRLTRQTPWRVCLLVRRPAQLTKVPDVILAPSPRLRRDVA